MKKYLLSAVIVALIMSVTSAFGWGPDEVKEDDEMAQAALADFKKKDPKVQRFIDVAVTAGAPADANFYGGMAIFTQAKGGLMYEPSVGGQKFKV